MKIKKIQSLLAEFRFRLVNSEKDAVHRGVTLSKLNNLQQSKKIQDYEFSVFSQWGEDGIIQKLISSVPIVNKTFIEFGVENFLESNCRFLMTKDNWSGYVIDGSDKNVETIKNSSYYWKFDLVAKSAFITAENINELLKESGFAEDLGLLSLDIDGVDYWVLKAIDAYRPRILILEYNSVFGVDRAVTVPYKVDFIRGKMHHTNLYFGASLPALANLADEKGYFFVGTNSAGGNAFFVRKDVFPVDLEQMEVREGFTESKFRESRDASGNLTFLSGKSRLDAIRGMAVVNVLNEEEEQI